MERLDNVIQRYAWGSHTAIPMLLGQAPDGGPQAELWLGAHPSAPSKVRSGGTLEALIAHSPERLLGTASTRQFGPRLPFLLKVLAAGQPLSLQAHPSLMQAKAGFAREEAAGLSRSAPNRNYRDANHKPEIICALTDFQALCGFRAAEASVQLLKGLGLDTTLLESQDLRAYFQHVMSLPKEAQGGLVDQLVDAARSPVKGFEGECALALRLSALYPRDIGIVGALLLNLVTLKPGEALYLDAGNLHAYLEGTGVELMANSDNVLRGGLTPKHVDVPELLSVLDFAEGPAKVLRPSGEGEAVYSTPAPDFRLSRVEVKGPQVTLPARGAQLLLVVEGEVTTQGVALKRGDSVFIGADEGDVPLSGRGLVFRATAGIS
ncbi:MAG: mannose-6-phosphate isomerase, class I [Archangium sp.]|nr:mannose-6-phosphate isomerase, class I [Archangium sp.]MDP3154892.1 mannose-6-phosphate isomerase, class I [Archangium sp.]MDP3576011.1 mannose-6-phosphate isomerase, class I [Archangium sp.]